MNSWYAKTSAEAIKELNSSEQGLAQKEAKTRLAKFGLNKLPEGKGRSIFAIFFEQFKSPLIYVLIGADIIVFSLQEFADGFIILFILLFNAVLGTIQEGRAQNTLKALTKFVETRAEVLRDGKELNIPDEKLVPGDIILLQEGEKIPADARLLEVHNLKTIEAALTGESEPVRKSADPIKKGNLTTPEQRNMIFKGTTVAIGSARAVVVATGLDTVIGKISESITKIDTEIPLTKNLRQLARTVVVIVSVLIVGLFLLGIIQGKDLKEMFIAAVAISVAAVPEGLPLILTVTLAAGVFRLAKRNVLVKKLQAVEALGQAKVIAVDKTGTITRNELTVEKVIVGGKEFDIRGVGYAPEPKIFDPAPELTLAAKVAAFCSNAHIAFAESGEPGISSRLRKAQDKNGREKVRGEYRLTGDPTEGALTSLAWKAGFKKEDLLKTYELVNDWPFDYLKKFHLAVYQEKGSPSTRFARESRRASSGNNKQFLAITGAPEVILKLSAKYYSGGRRLALGQKAKKSLEEKFLNLSKGGLRVIGFGFALGKLQNVNPDKLPPLIFGGFFAMRDGLRLGIKENVSEAKAAGIKVIMITGDHAITAKTIAGLAGIYEAGDEILTGEEMDKMGEVELKERLTKATVFARVTPEHKMKIIDAYRGQGEVVAMTGDGVNDAPSLVEADLGIAMGKIGTEVAKEAADLVLLKDNFQDIINAVEEGRNMREGLRRAITYLFSSNLGEILMITLALAAGLPLPLLAAQIIWMNVVTDTFFDISLALEPKSEPLIKKKFVKPKKLFDWLTAVRLMIIAPLIAIFGFLLFSSELNDPARARTLALTSLVIFQWFNSLNCRSEEKSIFQLNFFSNKFLISTLIGVIILHSFAVYSPFMNELLKISPLAFADWLKIAALGLIILGAEELRKFFYRRRLNAAAAKF